MKSQHDALRLRNALPGMPDETKTAFLNTVRSVKEEEPMKRTAFRTMLIAAALLVVMMLAALAAGHFLGWQDLMADSYHATLPDTAQEQAAKQTPLSYTVKGIQFTVREYLTDGRHAITATEVTGDNALFCMDPMDTVDALQEHVPAALGVKQGTTWIDAAKQLNKKLYMARALLEVEPNWIADSQMEEMQISTDGTTSLLSMTPLRLPEGTTVLQAPIRLSVMPIDLNSGEAGEQTYAMQTLEMPIAPPAADGTYLPEGDAVLGGCTVQSIHASLTNLGTYVDVTLQAPDGMTQDQVDDAIGELEVRNEKGEAFGTGISMSTEYNTEQLPAIVVKTMVSTGNSLPDVMQIGIYDEEAAVTLRKTAK